MPNFMESAKSTLVISNLVRVVGALTDVERDCLAAKLGMPLEEQLYVSFASALTEKDDMYDELVYSYTMRSLAFFTPIVTLERLKKFTEIAEILLALNCVLEDPSTSYEQEIREKYHIPDAHSFFVNCAVFTDNEDSMWWRYEQSCVHKVIAVAVDLLGQE